MKKNLLNLRTVVLTLACLLGISAWAQGLTPEDGKTYRIKNVRSGKYLTMTDASKTAVALNERSNSEYQFWLLSANTNYSTDEVLCGSIRNVGWQNNGDVKAYLGSSATTSSTAVTAGTSIATRNGWYTFQARSTAGQYSIVVRGKTVGLCSTSDGGSCILYNKDDDGAAWVLEEATVVQPEVVSIKNSRSGKYMYDNNGNVSQRSAVNAAAKWIRYQMGDGVALINFSTHKILQGPAKNANAVTGTNICTFTEVTDGTYTAFGTQHGSDMIYLNDKGAAGTTVAGWTGALDDAGNKWIVKKVADITEEEVKDIIRSMSPYATEIENGKYYRLYNEARGNYAFDLYREGRVGGSSLNEDDYTQVWKAVKYGTGFRLQGVASSKYIVAGSGLGGGTAYAYTVSGSGTSFTVSVNTGVSNDYTKYFNFMSGSYALHMASDARVVNWWAGSGSLTASEWLLCEVEVDADKLAAAQEEYERFAAVESDFNAINSKVSTYETILAKLFEDKACTTLKAEAQAMGEDEFADAIKNLPELLQTMCLKIKNDTWTRTKGGRNMEKYFRIADYKVYSKSNQICWEVGTSNAFSRLSNPTGISGDENDIIAIFVDEDCPSGATLMCELTDGGEKDNPRTGEQSVLRRGLNLRLIKKNQDIFIFYEIDGSGNSSAYFLDKFKDMKIHIEGGTCNGYFDQTRDMTDEQWADMVASGMLRHGRVFLKGSHAIGNWPSSILLAHNPNKIADICEFYNQIPKWEQEIMGVNNTYLPTIEQRFRNVYTALGTDLGSAYMYSTTYGTFYNWGTLGEILDPSVLSNQGLQWGPAHEFGHNHQALFNMVGCTEVSNNVFSNAVIYKMGAGMSRGVALSELIARYAYKDGNVRSVVNNNIKNPHALTTTESSNWMDLGIWCKTQMYWKLYQYFHLAGYDTEFFPKVFNIMRSNGLRHQNGQLVPASTDYLRFAEVCCEAAQADLSEFFEMYCFFRPLTTDTEKNGVACRYIDDYSTYYLYVTDEMIQNTLDYCHSFPKKIKNIGFIDDRIRTTPATYPGAPSGKVRGAMDGGGDNSVGTEGELGMYLDYYPENYVPCTQYTANVTNATNGRTLIKVNKNSGQGAMGFKVYSPEGELMFFFNEYNYYMPDLREHFGDYDNTNIVIMAADAQGNDVPVHNPKYFEVGVGEVSPVMQSDVFYDLQGRRVNRSAKGLYIINGKKVIR